jgi:hypothetical protein
MTMGANTLINTRNVIEGADVTLLDAYPAAAPAVIVTCFKNWGLGHVTLASLGLPTLKGSEPPPRPRLHLGPP